MLFRRNWELTLMALLLAVLLWAALRHDYFPALFDVLGRR